MGVEGYGNCGVEGWRRHAERPSSAISRWSSGRAVSVSTHVQYCKHLIGSTNSAGMGTNHAGCVSSLGLGVVVGLQVRARVRVQAVRTSATHTVQNCKSRKHPSRIETREARIENRGYARARNGMGWICVAVPSWRFVEILSHAVMRALTVPLGGGPYPQHPKLEIGRCRAVCVNWAVQTMGE